MGNPFKKWTDTIVQKKQPKQPIVPTYQGQQSGQTQKSGVQVAPGGVPQYQGQGQGGVFRGNAVPQNQAGGPGGQPSQPSGYMGWQRALGLPENTTFNTGRPVAADQQSSYRLNGYRPTAQMPVRFQVASQKGADTGLYNAPQGPNRSGVQPNPMAFNGQITPVDLSQYTTPYWQRRSPDISASGTIGPNTKPSLIDFTHPLAYTTPKSVIRPLNFPPFQGPPAPDSLPLTIEEQQQQMATGGGGGGGGGYASGGWPGYGGGGGGRGGGYDQKLPPWYYGLSTWRI